MKCLWLTAFICFTVFTAQAQVANNYDVSLIPKDLMPYASAVVRRMEQSTEVKDVDNMLLHYKQVVTILNKNGEDEADIQVFHNKQYHIKNIKGLVYDQYGKVISKIAEKNFNDYSAASDASMFEDSRVKHFKPVATDYPYTVEYEYDIQSKQSLNISDWQPNPSSGTAVEYSSYTFKCKPGFIIRYKELNFPGKVAITSTPQQTTYFWEIKNLKAVRSEPYSPAPEKFLTFVKIAPEKFSYDGYNGSFTDWNSLGQWVYDNLLKTRGTLSPETVKHMHELTDSIADPKRKAKAIYEYMQHKTRYVSIQVGIGGYQPFPATDVDNLSYGDCKALVNYTQSLLKAVDIDSYYCVVTGDTRKQSMLPDFASMAQGNHIILCLPFKNDTTWLECTSKTEPFGFLGDFTDDRTVLACTPQGGKLLHTPKYSATDNRQTRTGKFTIKVGGELEGSMETTCTGTQFEYYEANTDGSYTDELKKLKEEMPINNLVIANLKLSQNKKQMPVSVQSLDLSAADYATVSNGRYFFLINIANRMSGVPREVRTRTTDVYINRGYTDMDEITYKIPAGYKMDNIPLNVSISKPFGKFTATAVLLGDKLVYKRQIQLLDGTYSKDTYQELVDFYQKVYDADHYNVSLVKRD